MSILILILQFSWINGISLGEELNDYVGVAFSPYVKDFKVNSQIILDRRSYNSSEISTMLNVISKKFKRISTFDMGYPYENSLEKQNFPKTKLEDGNANGRIALETAKLNANKKNLLITIALGVNAAIDEEIYQEKEISNALFAVNQANSIADQTVWGVTYSTYKSMNDGKNRNEILKRLQNHKIKTKNLNVKIGVKINDCSMVKNISNQDIENSFNLISKEIDYFICVIIPHNYNDKSVNFAVDRVLESYENTDRFLKSLNPNIILIGETGWPSCGISESRSVNNVRNMKEYHRLIGNWAYQNKKDFFMFTSFDEPWKNSEPENDNFNIHYGKYGAERHFGWWKTVNNQGQLFYEEKTESDDKDCPLTKYLDSKSIITTSINVKEDSTSVGLIIGISIGLIVIISSITLAIYFAIKLKYKKDYIPKQEIYEFFHGLKVQNNSEYDLANFDYALALPYDKTLEISQNRLNIDRDKILGEGQFGIVFQGTIEGIDGEIAFKTSKQSSKIETTRGLLSEIKIMMFIGSHENIVKLIGASTKKIKTGSIFIASEYCSRGSLLKNLHHLQKKKIKENNSISNDYLKNISEYTFCKNDINIDFEEKEHVMGILSNWAHGIACGMEHLSNKKVIHADLAARNVLIDSNGIPKISDFGLSRRLYEYTEYVKKSQDPLPWRWMAIESLKFHKFTTQSDVWAFGVTLWEIYSLGEIPFPGLNYSLNFIKDLENGLRHLQPNFATHEIYSIMESCWINEPLMRRTFTELKIEICDICGKYNNYVTSM